MNKYRILQFFYYHLPSWVITLILWILEHLGVITVPKFEPQTWYYSPEEKLTMIFWEDKLLHLDDQGQIRREDFCGKIPYSRIKLEMGEYLVL